MQYAESFDTITSKELWWYTRGASPMLAIALHDLLIDVSRMPGWNIYAMPECYDEENGGVEQMYMWVQDRRGRAIDIHGMPADAGLITEGEDVVMQMGYDRLQGWRDTEVEQIVKAKKLVLANPAYFGLPDPP